MKSFIPIIVCLSLFSCNNQKNQSDYCIIDLEKSLKANNVKNLSLNDIAEEINITPVKTNDSTLLEYIFIAGVSENRIISYDQNSLYSIDKESGSVNKIITNQGAGPEEYKYIFDVIIENNEVVNIYDTGKRGFLKYDLNGNFQSFTKIDSITTFRRLPDGNFYVCYSPFINSNYNTGVYSKDWKYIRSGIINNRSGVYCDMYYVNDLRTYNKKLLFKDIFGDTIYNVTTEKDKPYVILSKGRFKAPIEVIASLEKSNKEGDKYIFSENFNIASKYCFVSYYYDKKQYRDIWDIEKSELIYRKRYSNDESSGISVRVNGIDITVWVNFAVDNYVYCVIKPEDAVKIIPSLSEDTNPIILEVKLKK